MSDGEYYSVKDQLRDEAARRMAKEFGLSAPQEPKTHKVLMPSEFEEIKRSLKWIMDKLRNIEDYIRSVNPRYGRDSRTVDGEVNKQKELNNDRKHIDT